jgi:hypothetical protein
MNTISVNHPNILEILEELNDIYYLHVGFDFMKKLKAGCNRTRTIHRKILDTQIMRGTPALIFIPNK